jgi:hypothetical protein
VGLVFCFLHLEPDNVVNFLTFVAMNIRKSRLHQVAEGKAEKKAFLPDSEKIE